MVDQQGTLPHYFFLHCIPKTSHFVVVHIFRKISTNFENSLLAHSLDTLYIGLFESLLFYVDVKIKK